MSDRPLQTIQDNIRLGLYGESLDQDGGLITQLHLNLIPQYAVNPSTQTKELSLIKRPGIDLINQDWMTGIVNNKINCVVTDIIAMTALYNKFVACVFDTGNSTYYIIEVNPGAAAVSIGSFAPTGANQDDFCFLTEFTQSSGGNALPAVAVSYTKKDLSVGKAYYAVTTAGAFTAASLTAISDVNFPANQTPALITIGRFIFLNSVMYIASLDGRIWNSTTNGNDVTTWSSTGGIGSISINAYTDQCIGLARYKHHIVAFGRASVEFFNDVGNTPCPLQRMEQAFIKFGTKSPRTIKNINDILYWVSYGEEGSVGVWQLDGYTPKKISTPFIDGVTSSTFAYADSLFFNMQATNIAGKSTLLINLPIAISVPTVPYFASSLPTGSDSSRTDTDQLTTAKLQGGILAYNIDDDTWYMLNVRGSINYGLMCGGSDFAIPSTTGTPNYYSQIILYNYQLPGTEVSQEYIYQWSPVTSWKDYAGNAADSDYPSVPITCVAQLNATWFNNAKRKRISRATVLTYGEPSASSDVASIYVFYAKDLSSNHTQTVRGCAYPNSTFRYYMNNLGMGRVWQFSIVESSKYKFNLRAFELDIQQGSH